MSDNLAYDAAIEERQAEEKQKVLEVLRQNPIILYAVKQAGVSRATFYRWRKEDSVFLKASDEALQEGMECITDMSEAVLIKSIKEGKLPAVALWLRTHHPKYTNRVEIIDRSPASGQLTPGQEATVREALKLARIGKHYDEKKRSRTSQKHR